jgi:hypothetical protein
MSTNPWQPQLYFNQSTTTFNIIINDELNYMLKGILHFFKATLEQHEFLLHCKTIFILMLNPFITNMSF